MNDNRHLQVILKSPWSIADSGPAIGASDVLNGVCMRWELGLDISRSRRNMSPLLRRKYRFVQCIIKEAIQSL